MHRRARQDDGLVGAGEPHSPRRGAEPSCALRSRDGGLGRAQRVFMMIPLAGGIARAVRLEEKRGPVGAHELCLSFRDFRPTSTLCRRDGGLLVGTASPRSWFDWLLKISTGSSCTTQYPWVGWSTAVGRGLNRLEMVWRAWVSLGLGGLGGIGVRELRTGDGSIQPMGAL